VIASRHTPGWACAVWLSVALLAIGAGSVSGQAFEVNWDVATGDWGNSSSWDTLFSPPQAQFDELAVISNGGTASVTGTEPDVGAIILGNNGGETGALEILSGGNLVSRVSDFLLTDGVVVVGNLGTGTLSVLPGGTLTAVGLTQGGSNDSTLILGGTAPGTATLTLSGAAVLERSVRIIGPQVLFNVDRLPLQPSSVLIAEITGSSHSPIFVTNAAQVIGALKVEFNGHVPALGDSWDIIDAGTLAGGFTTVDISDAGLARGLGVRVVQEIGGTNGNVLRARVENSLILMVNRVTGAAVVENVVGDPISFDGYSIGSVAGVLDPNNSAWTSLEDAAVGTWEEANPTATLLTETNPSGSSTLGADQSLGLGNPYIVPTGFGQTIEDLTFEYAIEGGDVVSGAIEYTGNHNNLVLAIDPLTGAGVLNNQSTFDVTIDGYAVASSSASLEPGDGDWFSFDDPTASLLTETNPTNSTLLGSGQTLSLGNLFTPGGTQDLQLEFSIDGGPLTQGIVEYTLNLVNPADLNMDGFVDGLDLGILLGSWNTTTTPDMGELNGTPPVDGLDLGLMLGAWNPPPLSSASAVPEPTTLLLALATAPLIARRRKA